MYLACASYLRQRRCTMFENFAKILFSRPTLIFSPADVALICDCQKGVVRGGRILRQSFANGMY